MLVLQDLWLGLNKDRIKFKELISKLVETGYLIIYIDEWSFNSSTITLYLWMENREPEEKINKKH